MSKLTDILGLFQYDPETDGANTFNITQALNNNWDKIDQLVLLAIAAAAAYDPEGSYAVGDYCTHGGKLQKCSTDIPSGEAWTAEHWTETSVAAELTEVRTSLSNKLEIHSNNSAGLDCNLLINDGRYQMAGQLLNSPPWVGSIYGHFFIDVFHHMDVWLRQTAYEVNSQRTYTRAKLNGTWTTWEPIATATPPQEYDIPLVDGITGTAKYCVDQFGYAHLRGRVVGVSALNTAFAYLPAECRPIDSGGTTRIIGQSGSYARMDISQAGRMVIALSGNLSSLSSWIDIDCDFRVKA